MEFEVSYDFENEQQFWDELHEAVSRECDTHTSIDDALRSYLNLTTSFRGEYINSDYDLARCTYNLYQSSLFQHHSDYVRRQIVHCLLQDDGPPVLQVVASFLLADAQENEITFELMNKEGAFPRLVDLISKPMGEEAALHRLLMELLYEMSRIQKIRTHDLRHVEDDFITHLFQIIEELSADVADPYHYPVIRVLLVLNEQFMVAAHVPSTPETSSVPLTNKVMKVLCAQGNKYKTFGENIILLLNREDETSLQLLTLKLLYLLFTTPQTYEYFYTNDLRVLVDILIRNLLDLPEDSTALRHTYLRVLYPLLAHTQLRNPPQYKRDEIRKLLAILARGQGMDPEVEGVVKQPWGHFGEVDETTKRLVGRCQKVAWLMDVEPEPITLAESPIDERSTTPVSPNSPSRAQPPVLPSPRKLTKRNSSKGSSLSIGPYLTPQLETARHSSLSMMEMAVYKEKPGVITPSRNPSLKHNVRSSILGKKEKPPPPKSRSSGWNKSREQINAENPIEDAKGDTKNTEAEARILPDVAQEPRAAESERPPPIFVTDASAPRSSSVSDKKPPPMPKARRWRGRQERDSVREPGKFNSNLPSITTKPSYALPPPPKVLPFSRVAKTLSPTTPSSHHPDPNPTTVTRALDEAQAEAISGIGEALEQIQLSRPQVPHMDSQRSAGVLMPIDERVPSPQDQRAVLAPPGLAPPRAVPGPRLELERSPFLSDEENEVGEASGSEDEVDRKKA